MKLLKALFLLCFILFGHLSLIGQELFCNISLDYSRLNNQSDRYIYQQMQQALNEYLNFQEWTDDKFEQNERIRAQLRIIITQHPSVDYFKGTASLVIYRPIYNSTYESVIANISDQNFSFNYVPGQPIQFNENTFTDNLTALLNFYAYIILGYDYASFGPNGGKEYFRKAQEWVELAQNSPEQGWNSSGLNQTNRYWLAENLNNSTYREYQNVLYKYHRKGLDQMTENMPRARRAILECVRDMQRLNRQRPLLFITRTFLDSKRDELIKVFGDAFVNDQKAFVEIMQDLDPKNASSYQAVIQGGR